jgi:hypothetical protein
MKRENVLQEVRQMRIQELYARRQQQTVTVAEAAEILVVTEWRFRRWGMPYDAEGVEGLQDRRLGHPSRRFLSQYTVRIFMVRATEPSTASADDFRKTYTGSTM